ncbi:MAG: BamA/TamA family outer membrane protein [Bryobacteraceae bacterium]
MQSDHPPSRRLAISRFATPIVLGLLLSLIAKADEEVTRAGRIREQQLAKLKALVPEQRSVLDERISSVAGYVMGNLTSSLGGLGVRFGGLRTGQGFALGPQFKRYGLLEGRLVFRTSAAGSPSGAYMFDVQATVPHLAGRRAFLDVLSTYGNYPRMDYYGQGPDSRKGGRSHFRLEENRHDLTVGMRAAPHLYAGFSAGYLGINVGRGNRDEVARTEDLYKESNTPGLQTQTDFLRGGVFLRVDYRDDPLGARSGGMYTARFNVNNDMSVGRYDFRTLDLEARQYFPFFNKRRVIALAGAATFSYANGTSVVPFYLQPTLGGSDDLRGFRTYRFYGNNLLVVNAEYRWETFSGMDAALFFDAGKVARLRSQVNFHNLETSAGFGLRFNARNRTFLRIDVGFSREGFQVWTKFGAAQPVRLRERAISGVR